jgi:pilus assembly protein CpaC
LLLVPLVLAPPAAAQRPGCPATIGGLIEDLPPTPQRGPRPATGPDSLSEFMEPLSSNDSAFEIVVGEGRILTTKARLSAPGKQQAFIAVGDPAVIDFTVVSPQQIRVTGLRIGVSDLSITTSSGQVYTYEVRVVADLNNLRAQLACLFPDASLRLAQFRDHIVIGGQARDSAQVSQILATVRAYLLSLLNSQVRRISGQQGFPGRAADRIPPVGKEGDKGGDVVLPDQRPPLQIQATATPPQIINLIRVPGSQQVLLKVRVAELNRTGLRQIGGDFLAIDKDTGPSSARRSGGPTSPPTPWPRAGC